MGEDSRKLFVGKLPQDIHEDEIRMIFNTYGRTTDVHLMSTTQQQPGQDRCAFVTYETEEAAKVAMQVLNGVYKFREEAPEPINVGPAFRRNKGGGGGKGALMDRGYGDFGKGGYDRGFGGYGGGYDRGYDRGYFDRFDRGYNGGPPDGYVNRYDRGYGGYDRGYDRGPRGYDRMGPRDYPPFRDSRSVGRKGGFMATNPTKLYVGNLPSDITRDAIDMVFSVYGRILDTHIMNGRAKNGQSCAFVVYSSLAEARSCMAAMQQGYEIRPGEGNIYVKFADEGGKGGSFGDKGR